MKHYVRTLNLRIFYKGDKSKREILQKNFVKPLLEDRLKRELEALFDGFPEEEDISISEMNISLGGLKEENWEDDLKDRLVQELKEKIEEHRKAFSDNVFSSKKPWVAKPAALLIEHYLVRGWVRNPETLKKILRDRKQILPFLEHWTSYSPVQQRRLRQLLQRRDFFILWERKKMPLVTSKKDREEFFRFLDRTVSSFDFYSRKALLTDFFFYLHDLQAKDPKVRTLSEAREEFRFYFREKNEMAVPAEDIKQGSDGDLKSEAVLYDEELVELREYLLEGIGSAKIIENKKYWAKRIVKIAEEAGLANSLEEWLGSSESVLRLRRLVNDELSAEELVEVVTGFGSVPRSMKRLGSLLVRSSKSEGKAAENIQHCKTMLWEVLDSVQFGQRRRVPQLVKTIEESAEVSELPEWKEALDALALEIERQQGQKVEIGASTGKESETKERKASWMMLSGIIGRASQYLISDIRREALGRKMQVWERQFVDKGKTERVRKEIVRFFDWVSQEELQESLIPVQCSHSEFFKLLKEFREEKKKRTERGNSTFHRFVKSVFVSLPLNEKKEVEGKLETLDWSGEISGLDWFCKVRDSFSDKQWKRIESDVIRRFPELAEVEAFLKEKKTFLQAAVWKSWTKAAARAFVSGAGGELVRSWFAAEADERSWSHGQRRLLHSLVEAWRDQDESLQAIKLFGLRKTFDKRTVQWLIERFEYAAKESEDVAGRKGTENSRIFIERLESYWAAAGDSERAFLHAHAKQALEEIHKLSDSTGNAMTAVWAERMLAENVNSEDSLFNIMLGGADNNFLSIFKNRIEKKIGGIAVKLNDQRKSIRQETFFGELRRLKKEVSLQSWKQLIKKSKGTAISFLSSSEQKDFNKWAELQAESIEKAEEWMSSRIAGKWKPEKSAKLRSLWLRRLKSADPSLRVLLPGPQKAHALMRVLKNLEITELSQIRSDLHKSVRGVLVNVIEAEERDLAEVWMRNRKILWENKPEKLLEELLCVLRQDHAEIVIRQLDRSAESLKKPFERRELNRETEQARVSVLFLKRQKAGLSESLDIEWCERLVADLERSLSKIKKFSSQQWWKGALDLGEFKPQNFFVLHNGWEESAFGSRWLRQSLAVFLSSEWPGLYRNYRKFLKGKTEAVRLLRVYSETKQSDAVSFFKRLLDDLIRVKPDELPDAERWVVEKTLQAFFDEKAYSKLERDIRSGKEKAVYRNISVIRKVKGKSGAQPLIAFPKAEVDSFVAYLNLGEWTLSQFKSPRELWDFFVAAGADTEVVNALLNQGGYLWPLRRLTEELHCRQLSAIVEKQEGPNGELNRFLDFLDQRGKEEELRTAASLFIPYLALDLSNKTIWQVLEEWVVLQPDPETAGLLVSSHFEELEADAFFAEEKSVGPQETRLSETEKQALSRVSEKWKLGPETLEAEDLRKFFLHAKPLDRWAFWKRYKTTEVFEQVISLRPELKPHVFFQIAQEKLLAVQTAESTEAIRRIWVELALDFPQGKSVSQFWEKFSARAAKILPHRVHWVLPFLKADRKTVEELAEGTDPQRITDLLLGAEPEDSPVLMLLIEGMLRSRKLLDFVGHLQVHPERREIVRRWTAQIPVWLTEQLVNVLGLLPGWANELRNAALSGQLTFLKEEAVEFHGAMVSKSWAALVLRETDWESRSWGAAYAASRELVLVSRFIEYWEDQGEADFEALDVSEWRQRIFWKETSGTSLIDEIVEFDKMKLCDVGLHWESFKRDVLFKEKLQNWIRERASFSAVWIWGRLLKEKALLELVQEQEGAALAPFDELASFRNLNERKLLWTAIIFSQLKGLKSDAESVFHFLKKESEQKQNENLRLFMDYAFKDEVSEFLLGKNEQGDFLESDSVAKLDVAKLCGIGLHWNFLEQDVLFKEKWKGWIRERASFPEVWVWGKMMKEKALQELVEDLEADLVLSFAETAASRSLSERKLLWTAVIFLRLKGLRSDAGTVFRFLQKESGSQDAEDMSLLAEHVSKDEYLELLLEKKQEKLFLEDVDFFLLKELLKNKEALKPKVIKLLNHKRQISLARWLRESHDGEESVFPLLLEVMQRKIGEEEFERANRFIIEDCLLAGSSLENAFIKVLKKFFSSLKPAFWESLNLKVENESQAADFFEKLEEKNKEILVEVLIQLVRQEGVSGQRILHRFDELKILFESPPVFWHWVNKEGAAFQKLTAYAPDMLASLSVRQQLELVVFPVKRLFEKETDFSGWLETSQSARSNLLLFLVKKSAEHAAESLGVDFSGEAAAHRADLLEEQTLEWLGLNRTELLECRPGSPDIVNKLAGKSDGFSSEAALIFIRDFFENDEEHQKWLHERWSDLPAEKRKAALSLYFNIERRWKPFKSQKAHRQWAVTLLGEEAEEKLALLYVFFSEKEKRDDSNFQKFSNRFLFLNPFEDLFSSIERLLEQSVEKPRSLQGFFSVIKSKQSGAQLTVRQPVWGKLERRLKRESAKLEKLLNVFNRQLEEKSEKQKSDERVFFYKKLIMTEAPEQQVHEMTAAGFQETKHHFIMLDQVFRTVFLRKLSLIPLKSLRLTVALFSGISSELLQEIETVFWESGDARILKQKYRFWIEQVFENNEEWNSVVLDTLARDSSSWDELETFAVKAGIPMRHSLTPARTEAGEFSASRMKEAFHDFVRFGAVREKKITLKTFQKVHRSDSGLLHRWLKEILPLEGGRFFYQWLEILTEKELQEFTEQACGIRGIEELEEAPLRSFLSDVYVLEKESMDSVSVWQWLFVLSEFSEKDFLKKMNAEFSKKERISLSKRTFPVYSFHWKRLIFFHLDPGHPFSEKSAVRKAKVLWDWTGIQDRNILFQNFLEEIETGFSELTAKLIGAWVEVFSPGNEALLTNIFSFLRKISKRRACEFVSGELAGILLFPEDEKIEKAVYKIRAALSAESPGLEKDFLKMLQTTSETKKRESLEIPLSEVSKLFSSVDWKTDRPNQMKRLLLHSPEELRHIIYAAGFEAKQLAQAISDSSRPDFDRLYSQWLPAELTMLIDRYMQLDFLFPDSDFEELRQRKRMMVVSFLKAYWEEKLSYPFSLAASEFISEFSAEEERPIVLSYLKKEISKEECEKSLRKYSDSALANRFYEVISSTAYLGLDVQKAVVQEVSSFVMWLEGKLPLTENQTKRLEVFIGNLGFEQRKKVTSWMLDRFAADSVKSFYERVYEKEYSSHYKKRGLARGITLLLNLKKDFQEKAFFEWWLGEHDMPVPAVRRKISKLGGLDPVFREVAVSQVSSLRFVDTLYYLIQKKEIPFWEEKTIGRDPFSYYDRGAAHEQQAFWRRVRMDDGRVIFLFQNRHEWREWSARVLPGQVGLLRLYSELVQEAFPFFESYFHEQAVFKAALHGDQLSSEQLLQQLSSFYFSVKKTNASEFENAVVSFLTVLPKEKTRKYAVLKDLVSPSTFIGKTMQRGTVGVFQKSDLVQGLFRTGRIPAGALSLLECSWPSENKALWKQEVRRGIKASRYGKILMRRFDKLPEQIRNMLFVSLFRFPFSAFQAVRKAFRKCVPEKDSVFFSFDKYTAWADESEPVDFRAYFEKELYDFCEFMKIDGKRAVERLRQTASSGEFWIEKALELYEERELETKDQLEEPPGYIQKQYKIIEGESMRMKSPLDWIAVENAGLVLLWPFLEGFFLEMEMLDEDGLFVDSESVVHAVYLLQYVAAGTEEQDEEETPEFDLSLNKVLCGLSAETPVERIREFEEEEIEACAGLLDSLLEKWEGWLESGATVEDFRESFLLRTAYLDEEKEEYILRVEERSADVLLDSLPWSLKYIFLPWMKKQIKIVWK
ncbi:MAG: hypothetical protein MI784_03425 [Cytophagales bacterium]|nr:hypothetical protein [Cytophagales bacterium]